jgi:hypothetical protein
MNTKTSSFSSIGGGKTLYILCSEFENDIVFAHILDIPDETLTMHLLEYGKLWQLAAVLHKLNLAVHLESLQVKGHLQEPELVIFSFLENLYI